jgi:cob(I)alamin adenosyltransferase
MKLYTGQGDSGMTSLFGGKKVPKSDIRVDLYGILDELNASLGFAVSNLETNCSDLKKDILDIQSLLFEIGTLLADPKKNKISATNKEDIADIEKKIDCYSEELEPLKNFILPGGTSSASALHVARTICRRFERSLVSRKEITGDNDLIYINRLSDFLFCSARITNKRNSVEDILWKKRERN